MSNSYGVELLSNAGAGSGAWVQWAGGHGVFAVGGTFGGTSITLEYRLPDQSAATFKTLATDGTQTAVALTVAGGFQFALPPGQIRAVVTGGTPSALFGRADRIPI